MAGSFTKLLTASIVRGHEEEMAGYQEPTTSAVLGHVWHKRTDILLAALALLLRRSKANNNEAIIINFVITQMLVVTFQPSAPIIVSS